MDPQTLEVSIDISIRNYHGGSNLAIRETVQIPEVDFMGMARLLEGFHNVAQAIKEIKNEEVR